MEQFEDFLIAGRKIGLEGKDLVVFAEKREATYKEQVQRDERQQEREHLKQMKEYELQIAEQQSNLAGTAVTISTGQIRNVNKPKLPPFQDRKDDLDAYIKRFERFAQAVDWPEQQWATILSTQLTGRALELYSRLPPDKASDYQELKKALLHRYDYTEEGFRLKFRTAKREEGETYSQFAQRMAGYLDRWTELVEVKDYETLKDLLVREQMLLACPKDLVVFLRERKPTSVKDMTGYADQYALAHDSNRNVERQKTPFRRPQVETKGSNPHSPVDPKTTVDNAVRCFVCGGKGHIARFCRNRYKTQGAFNKDKAAGVEVSEANANANGRPTVSQPLGACVQVSPCQHVTSSGGKHVKLACGGELPIVSAACSLGGKMPVVQGMVGDQRVEVLRDTGCSTTVVQRSLVKESQFLPEERHCVLIDGTVRKFPAAEIQIDTPYYQGTIVALCIDKPLYGLVLGNISGVRKPEDPDPNWQFPLDKDNAIRHAKDKETEIGAVETRSQKEKKNKPFSSLKVHDIQNIASSKEFAKAQKDDVSLEKIWKFAEEGSVRKTGIANEIKFVKKKDMLVREFTSPNVEKGRLFKQLVVPSKYREQVMKVAHDSVMSGHLGAKKTSDRVLANFYWPGLLDDIKRYCASCDICQRTIAKGKVARVPLDDMPLIDTPFRRIAVDIVGPIQPVTDKGSRYILTVVDYATRYPEAVALPKIEAERVAEALLTIFSRVGVPQEILTDLGTQFTAEVMKEVSRLISMKQLHTTPYHPICNGLCERFNGTLKRMLRRMCVERPKDWDRYLPALLFSYREAPQESLGFSPFELLYGRTVRGPLAILRELWSKENDEEEVKTTYEYVVELRNRLERTCQLAQDELAKSAKRYKKYYDVRTRDRKFTKGDKVLVLLPTDSNKLLVQWQGPFEVTKKVGKNDYVIDKQGKDKIYHANLLKKYVERQNDEITHASACLENVGAGILNDHDCEVLDEVEFPPVKPKETVQNVHISDKCDKNEVGQVKELLDEFHDVLTDVPGKTNLVEYTMKLTTSDPVQSKPYAVPHARRDSLKHEIDEMLQMRVIEKSTSPYASPIVLVPKSDGSLRFCIDYRKLNSVTIFDPEPIPNIEDLFSKISKGTWFTKLDLSKGYWQIPIKESDRDKTAFITSEGGLFQFTVLPFGMVNAPAVFTRMMRLLLEGFDNVINYIDDYKIGNITNLTFAKSRVDLYSED
ncbi:uncharacterized protein LOC119726874 [Patiria miniata]|uniref:Reverse transcriptase n=1 Tax=Patiria miniata TaxID=46514 RepID=A0A913ZTW8_PATMI|nr:uncharacterized protein LOC119726874 [Patiria miniata]